MSSPWRRFVYPFLVAGFGIGMSRLDDGGDSGIVLPEVFWKKIIFIHQPSRTSWSGFFNVSMSFSFFSIEFMP